MRFVCMPRSCFLLKCSMRCTISRFLFQSFFQGHQCTFSVLESYSIYHHTTNLHIDNSSMGTLSVASSLSSSKLIIYSLIGCRDCLVQFIIDELMCIHSGSNFTPFISQIHDGPNSIPSKS
jgi:hypothetical protein